MSEVRERTPGTVDQETAAVNRDAILDPASGRVATIDPSGDHQAFVAQLIAWAEVQAIRSVDGADAPLDDFAAEFDGRVPAWRRRGYDGSGRASGNTFDDPIPPELETWHAAAPTELPRLGLTREDNSASNRYVLSCSRVDEAYDHLLARLEKALRIAANSWRSVDLARARKLQLRIESTARRRKAFRLCCTGDLQVPVLRCRVCQQEQIGGAMTCRSRVCPRCVPKLRRENQAKVLELLELVDRRRKHRGAVPARWRFVTLTVPSGQQCHGCVFHPAPGAGEHTEFDAARRHTAQLWGRLLQAKFWDNVHANVACWETTHTRAGWHVHVHALVDAFVPRPLLVRRWQQLGLRAVLADAMDKRRIYREQPLLQVTVRALRCLDFASRTADLALELRDLLPAALGRAMPSTADRRTRVMAKRQARRLLTYVARPAGQHVSEPHGDRQQIARELAKYIAKDLGSAGVPDGSGDPSFGVAGTPERLAEFMAGCFRWRTLRAYGDAYFAGGEVETGCECEKCGAVDMEFVEVKWMTEQAFERLRNHRRKKRGEQRKPEPETKIRTHQARSNLPALLSWASRLRLPCMMPSRLGTAADKQPSGPGGPGGVLGRLRIPETAGTFGSRLRELLTWATERTETTCARSESTQPHERDRDYRPSLRGFRRTSPLPQQQQSSTSPTNSTTPGPSADWLRFLEARGFPSS